MLEENREGQDPESHGARSGSGPRARGTRFTNSPGLYDNWVGAPRARNARERTARVLAGYRRGPARAERAVVASMESWSRRGMPSGETPARPRPPYVRWCSARVTGPPASLPVMHLWVAIARLAVGHPARPRLGKPGRERREVTRRGLVPALQSTHRTSPAPS